MAIAGLVLGIIGTVFGLVGVLCVACASCAICSAFSSVSAVRAAVGYIFFSAEGNVTVPALTASDINSRSVCKHTKSFQSASGMNIKAQVPCDTHSGTAVNL